jgi:hypothetical protein
MGTIKIHRTFNEVLIVHHRLLRKMKLKLKRTPSQETNWFDMFRGELSEQYRDLRHVRHTI